MADKNENETLASTLSMRLEKSKGVVFAVCGVVVAVIVIAAVFAAVTSKSVAAGIERIDSISHALTKDADKLPEDDAERAAEIAVRQNKALEALSPLAEKSGVVGLRANMLVAEIKFAQKNYEDAKSAWLKAVAAKNKNYTTPLCYYNAAVASEELGDNEGALSCYKSACEDEDFLLIDHALFSLGRVSESARNYEDAKSAYEKLVDLHSTSSWGQLAKSRLIALKAAGDIQ